MARDWGWVFGALPLLLAATICIILGLAIGNKYPLSRRASLASVTLLTVGATGLGLAALALLAMLLLE